jgi:hypothetical protein
MALFPCLRPVALLPTCCRFICTGILALWVLGDTSIQVDPSLLLGLSKSIHPCLHPHPSVHPSSSSIPPPLTIHPSTNHHPSVHQSSSIRPPIIIHPSTNHHHPSVHQSSSSIPPSIIIIYPSTNLLPSVSIPNLGLFDCTSGTCALSVLVLCWSHHCAVIFVGLYMLTSRPLMSITTMPAHAHRFLYP